MIQSREYLKSRFLRKFKPKQEDFESFLDSFIHKTEDLAKIGLREFNSTKPYFIGDTIIQSAQMLKAKVNTQGSFNPDHWVPAISCGVKRVINENEKVLIASDYQAVVYGSMEITGELIVEGELIII